MGTVRLAERGAKLQVYGCGTRLLSRQRFEYLESRLQLPCQAVRSAQYQPGTRFRRYRPQNLSGLLGSETRVLLQKTRGVSERHLQRSDGFRGDVPTHVVNLPRSHRPRTRAIGHGAHSAPMEQHGAEIQLGVAIVGRAQHSGRRRLAP